MAVARPPRRGRKRRARSTADERGEELGRGPPSCSHSVMSVAGGSERGWALRVKTARRPPAAVARMPAGVPCVEHADHRTRGFARDDLGGDPRARGGPAGVVRAVVERERLSPPSRAVPVSTPPGGGRHGVLVEPPRKARRRLPARSCGVEVPAPAAEPLRGRCAQHGACRSALRARRRHRLGIEVRDDQSVAWSQHERSSRRRCRRSRTSQRVCSIRPRQHLHLRRSRRSRRSGRRPA